MFRSCVCYFIDENSIGPTLEVMHAVELVQFTDCFIFFSIFFLSAADEWQTKEQNLKKINIYIFDDIARPLEVWKNSFFFVRSLKYFISLNAQK